jgi:hypothetical protein
MELPLQFLEPISPSTTGTRAATVAIWEFQQADVSQGAQFGS